MPGRQRKRAALAAGGAWNTPHPPGKKKRERADNKKNTKVNAKSLRLSSTSNIHQTTFRSTRNVAIIIILLLFLLVIIIIVIIVVIIAIDIVIVISGFSITHHFLT